MSWKAPRAHKPVVGTAALPGSKSITNRALILAALASGSSRITGTLRSRDTDLMLDGLASLGIKVSISEVDPTDVTITPAPMGTAALDCGLAGTVMRFLPPAAALATGVVTFDGDEQARARPLTTILDALRSLGVTVEGDRLPFTLTAIGVVRGGDVTIDASGSSQFVSGLLLSGARYNDGVRVHHTGAPVPSTPHIDMSVAMLRTAGVQVDTGIVDQWLVAPGVIRPVDWLIEPDLSNAAAFLAAAAATAGSVSVPRWPTRTTQPGASMVQILRDMGCETELSDGQLTVAGPKRLAPVILDLHDIGELTPTVAALATLADGESRLSGIAHLRGHETNRLAALSTEINRLGGSCEETGDGLRIQGGGLHGGMWRTYADHRMATAGALIGLAVDDVEIDDITTTSKTLPGFAAMWTRLVGAS